MDVGHPIIYVRGYAGSQAEVEDTVADPYMGFNWGSMKLRQEWSGDVARHVFESPLVRLMKDEGYADGYRDGAELPRGVIPPRRTVFIYRYYEPVSQALGTGRRPEIEDYALGLDRYIEDLRDRYCGKAKDADAATLQARRDFRVYLLAHSMGGLVVRCYLQNVRGRRHAERVAVGDARQDDPVPVDKVFTYATPHGGIDFRLVGNVPRFLTKNNIDNFNEARMDKYLALEGAPTNSLNGCFDPERFFCLVGTNHRDYEAAMGLSSFAVGSSSDGLVQIKNAAVQGSPRAYVYRSHSGHYGIVNSEEGYQNLRRFLFGDVRVDAFLEVDEVRLPPKVRRAKRDGREIRASYHIEAIARVRRARWDLHRRLVSEESSKFVPYKRMTDGRPLQLASTYLLPSAARATTRLGFSLDLLIQVPDYEIERDGVLGWFGDDHHEGGYLLRDKVNLELVRKKDQLPELRFGFDSRTPNRVGSSKATMTQVGDHAAGVLEYRIPIAQRTDPGFVGRLLIRARSWNS